MNYMPIVPLGMFDVLKQSGIKSVFTLAQYFQNEIYRDFYTNNHWDTVILDNAIYEDSKFMDFGEMIDIAKTLDADQVFIVSPEDVTNGLKTAELAAECANIYGVTGDTSSGIWNMMTILHEFPNEMKQQYEIIKSEFDDDIADLALGISIFSFRQGYDRASLLRFCDVDTSDHPYIHAFGWDNILEAFNLNYTGFNSVDSSMAVTAAIRGIDITDKWNIPRAPGLPDARYVNKVPRVNLMETSFTTDQKKQSLININILSNICRQ